MDELTRKILRDRLKKIKQEIDYRKRHLKDEGILYHHYKGFLEAADGMFGERQFLEGILEVEKKGESASGIRSDDANDKKRS